jgi:ABC-type dipeptide/oligopeptide/nickel transport system permease subunit
MKNTGTNPLKTLLTISTGFILVYLITGWNWAIIVSFVIGLTGILSGYLSRKIDFIWMKLGQILGLLVPGILLGIVFYLFLFPISILSKLFGKKDPLQLKNKNASMFIISNKHFEKESFEKTW